MYFAYLRILLKVDWQVCNAGVKSEANERAREISRRICQAKAARVFWPGKAEKSKIKLRKISLN